MGVNILAIETSCDETSAAVIEDGRHLRSNIVATQVKSHMRFGGVVPEIASRHHVEQINQIIAMALEKADLTMADIAAIAVTKGPGLVGALLIGLTAAKTLALVHGLPLIGVNHLVGHVYANRLVNEEHYPALALVVSGGHTELLYMQAPNNFVKIGDTRDDAVGEAYDKIGRVLDLPYPAGKPMDELAQKGQDIYNFPRPMLGDGSYDFSFSGLKSAVINHLHNMKQRGESWEAVDIAASFQAAAVEVLVEKTCQAVLEKPVKQVIVCGGVAANQGLRHALTQRLSQEAPEVKVDFPPISLCGDNAAMIGAAAYENYRQGDFADLSLDAIPSLDFA